MTAAAAGETAGREARYLTSLARNLFFWPLVPVEPLSSKQIVKGPETAFPVT